MGADLLDIIEDNHDLVEEEQIEEGAEWQEEFAKECTLVATFICETIAGFLLIFMVIGCEMLGPQDTLFISFANGLAEMTMIYAFGGLNANFNPAVSICFFINGTTSFVEVSLQILGQYIGGTLAIFTLMLVVNEDMDNSGQFSCLHLNKNTDYADAFIAETICTSLFCFIIFQTAASNAKDKGAALSASIAHPQAAAWCVMLCVMFTFPITGSSLNPMRGFVTAIGEQIRYEGAHHSLDHMELYILAPALGGVIVGTLERIAMKSIRNILVAHH